MSILTRRVRVAAVVLTTAALVAAAPAADAARATRTTNASGFVAHQLAGSGHHFSTSFNGQSFPDYGLTADAILSLDAGKTSRAEATRATTYLGNHLGAYIGSGGEQYAGATAKALVVSLAQRRPNKGFLGGVNLISRLTHLMTAQGRFADKSAFGDFSNTFGQAFAIIGLRKAGRGVSAKAVSFLVRQQCPGGGFRLDLAASRCGSSAMADPDATSMAVQALKTIRDTRATRPAIRRGWAFLLRHQAAGGGFGGGATTNAVNSNSTSLAIVALAGSGHTARINHAEAYLRRMQYGCGFAPALRGGVAYNAAGRHAAGRKASDQDRRSTTQAVLGLGAVQLIDVSNRGSRKTAIAMKCR